MLAAILLCGSVVTFVACRGNSLEDIIGNSDNTVPEEVIKELLGALDDNAEITFDIKYKGGEWHPVLKKVNGEYELQNPDVRPVTSSGFLNPALSYDAAKNHIIFAIIDTHYNTPMIGVIFDVETNSYAVANYDSSVEFLGVTIKGDEKVESNKIKNALAKTTTVVSVNNTDENELFYVYYNDGETWDDIYNRYKEAFGTNCPIKAKADADSNIFAFYWSGSWNHGLKYDADNPTKAKYDEKVGINADQEVVEKYYEDYINT